MKKLYIFALVAMLFAACTTDATEDVAAQIETPDTLVGTFEGDDSRIQLQEGKTVWTKGDLVSVFYRSNANQKWQYQGETGERTGTIKRVADAEATQELSNIVVVYPYNENYYINPKTNNVQASLPATQTYLKDSYGLDGNIMISQSEYNQFSLKNVCGWLKVQLTGNGEKVQSIKLKGNNGEQVAGEIYINSADATATLASEMGGADDGENSAGGNLVFDDTILTEVVLNCGEGVTLSSEATAFYIALPPQTFDGGITVEISTTDGATMTKSTDNSIVIERNHIQPMTTFVYDGVRPQPNNEIWYTSTDGTIITPPCGSESEAKSTEFETFGANIVSNTYENGKGVIKFDGPISKIGRRAFYKCSTLKTITHPHTVLEIGDEAFYDCPKLSDFVFLDGLTSIGASAFSKAYKSTTVTLPESITHIGNSAFAYCSKIESFYGKFASEDNKCLVYDGTLIRLANVKGDYVLPESIIKIGARSISGFSEQVSLTMPESLQSLPTSSPITETANVVAFKGKFATEDNRSLIYNNILFGVAQYGLTEYSVPEGVTKLSDWLLMTTGGLVNYLETVVLPSSLTDVGVNHGVVFQGCRKLKYLYCKAVNPPTMHGKMESMFKGINPLPTIYVPAISVDAYKSAEGWKEFADYIVADEEMMEELPTTTIKYSTSDESMANTSGLFVKSHTYSSGVGELVVYGVLKSFPSTMFGGNAALTSITIPDSITRFTKDAFKGCTSLHRVDITDLSAWCKATFSGNSAANPLYSDADLYLNGELVEELTIPSDITSLNFAAFWHCTSLTSVTIPDSVTSIDKSAFVHCINLKSVTIGNSVTKIGDYAFRECTSLTSITIPDSVTSIGKSVFYDCTSLTRVDIADLSAWCKIDFGASSANPLYNRGNLYIDGVEATNITIPSDITEIKQYAFYGCNSLTITIPDSVTSIGMTAFFNCNCLTSITIPDSVVEIGAHAFASCRKLGYFYGKFASNDNRCLIVDNILNSYAGGAKVTSYEIPSNITAIDAYAFQDNDYLKSVTIHDGVTSIGTQAFYHCSALESVYCKHSTPPTGGKRMFSYDKNDIEYPIGCKIYVPIGSGEAYKAKEYWSDYASYIEEKEF